MDEKRKGRFDIANWIVLTTTLFFAAVIGEHFGSTSGETKDYIGGFIIGLVPGFVFSVVVVPFCALIITAQRMPKTFLRYICLPALLLAAFISIISGF